MLLITQNVVYWNTGGFFGTKTMSSLGASEHIATWHPSSSLPPYNGTCIHDVQTGAQGSGTKSSWYAITVNVPDGNKTRNISVTADTLLACSASSNITWIAAPSVAVGTKVWCLNDNFNYVSGSVTANTYTTGSPLTIFKKPGQTSSGSLVYVGNYVLLQK